MTFETKEDAIKRILAVLRTGPRLSFGSSRVVDGALRHLKKLEMVVYKPTRKGGKGWELVK